MALSLADVGSAASIGSFVLQVQGALQTAVTNVLSELNTQPDHEVRLRFARKAEMNIGAFSIAMAVPVAQQLVGVAATLAAATDAQVQTAMNSIFTGFAYSVILP